MSDTQLIESTSMEPKLTVFASAAEITINVDSKGEVELSAPGYLCDVRKHLLSNGICLRSAEEDVAREGFDSKLSYIFSDDHNSRPLCHFTSLVEANQLIANIVEARKPLESVEKLDERPYVPYRKPWSDVVKSCVEATTIALAVGFLGAGAANIGWNLTAPVAARIAGVPNAAEQYAIDRADYSSQVDDLISAIPEAVRAASNTREAITQRQILDQAVLGQVGQTDAQSFINAYQADLEQQRVRQEEILMKSKAIFGPADAEKVLQVLKPGYPDPAIGNRSEVTEAEARQALREEIRQHIPPFALTPEHTDSADFSAQTVQN